LSAAAAWLWVPITLWAALAQTARNAAQRSLVAQAGTLGATLARFLYGIPFAAAWVVLLHALPATAAPRPAFGLAYSGWLLLGALGQLAATAFLLAAMKQRNFVVGVAYSKTDALQVALFGALFLRELPGAVTLAAIALATAGVVMLSLPQKGAALEGRAWTSGAAWYGLASGAGFALSAVGYRGAALQIPESSAWLAGAWGVLLAQAIQTILLGGWLAWRQRAALRATVTAWRVSTVAGAAGALASIGWFTAFALTTAANVRTLGMVEVVFSYLVSRRFLREKLAPVEQGGLAMVVAGLLALGLQL
jgi:drug/metabolite transporter (DMT)-like permease